MITARTFIETASNIVTSYAEQRTHADIRKVADNSGQYVTEYLKAFFFQDKVYKHISEVLDTLFNLAANIAPNGSLRPSTR